MEISDEECVEYMNELSNLMYCDGKSLEEFLMTPAEHQLPVEQYLLLYEQRLVVYLQRMDMYAKLISEHEFSPDD